jgi:hypothetical protein
VPLQLWQIRQLAGLVAQLLRIVFAECQLADRVALTNECRALELGDGDQLDVRRGASSAAAGGLDALANERQVGSNLAQGPLQGRGTPASASRDTVSANGRPTTLE